jgi:hypothetical protein
VAWVFAVSSTAAAIVEEISDSLSMVPDVDMNVPQKWRG